MDEQGATEKPPGAGPDFLAAHSEPRSDQVVDVKSARHATEKADASESDDGGESKTDGKKGKENAGSLKDYVVSSSQPRARWNPH